MSGAGRPTNATRESVSLRIPAETPFVTVARLLVGGIGTRLDLSYEELDDLQLATELMLVTLVGEGSARELTLGVSWDDDELTLTVGPSVRAGTSPSGEEELGRLLAALGARLEIEREETVARLHAMRPISRPPA